MAQKRIIPSQVYQPGDYAYELNTLPGNSAGCRLEFTRENWPAGIVAHIDAWMSRDNGATWLHVQGGDFTGGTAYDKQGNIRLVDTMVFTWPGEAGPNGRVTLKGSDVKMTATVYQAMQTQITIESITSTAGG